MLDTTLCPTRTKMGYELGALSRGTENPDSLAAVPDRAVLAIDQFL
jgi:hypothetical protein